MSKITFRADDDLVQQLEAFDSSKSEVLREALRSYLGEQAVPSEALDAANGRRSSLDDLVRERVDDAVADRVAALLGTEPADGPTYTRPGPAELTVNVTIDGVASDDEAVDAAVNVAEPPTAGGSIGDGSTEDEALDDEALDDEAASGTRTQCAQCGETVAPSHVYCANCGAKAANRLFCECGDELRSDWSFCPGCGRRTAAADVLDQPPESPSK